MGASEGAAKAGFVRVEIMVGLPIPADSTGSQALTALRNIVIEFEQHEEDHGGRVNIGEVMFA